MKQEDRRRFTPKNPDDWRAWLKKNHQTEEGIWVIFYKKKSKKVNLTWSEAVDEALCFGWIDSVKKSIDEEKYRQYFSQRKAKSTWSKVNKDKVEKLIASGKMEEAGLLSIEKAKENGSWEILDEVEALLIPKDLEEAFQAFSEAKTYFLTLSPSVRKILLAWIVLAKKPETRKKRVLEVAKNAQLKQKPKGF